MNVQVYLRLDPLALARPDFAMPGLEHLLAKGSVSKNTNVLDAVLCRSFGIEKQRDWPAAAVSWLGEGYEPQDYFWLYADPVNLQLQRDHFSMNWPAPVPTSSAEAEVLSALLNQHFSQNGLRFCIAASGRWYMRLDEPMAVTTSALDQAVGRDIRNFLPTGDGAEELNSLFNEIQMLLHEHDVNQVREERGQMAINSLWFSAGGQIPTFEIQPKTVYTHVPLAKGLARLAGTVAMPTSANLAFSGNEQESAVLVLDSDEQNDAQWLEPVLKAMRGREIKQLSLDIFLHDQHVHTELKQHDMWKFWRKPQPLRAYFQW
ncbi:MAG TPA: hypothetical protein VFF75_09440 [Methylophilaceae bacterium]|nr:hypothetical protein [Methylophilaceae bacterium]